MSEEQYVPQGKICNYLINQDKNDLFKAYYARFPRQSDDCWNMARNFILMGKDEFSDIDADEKSFYKILKFWDSQNLVIYGKKYPHDESDYYRLKSPHPEFNYLNFLNRAGLEIFRPCFANIQKWHLFVGLFSYSLVCKHSGNGGNSNPVGNDFNFKDPSHFWEVSIMTVKSYELMLWMIVNAESRYDLEHPDADDKQFIFNSVKNLINDEDDGQQSIKKSATGKFIKDSYTKLFGNSDNSVDEEVSDKYSKIRMDIMNESSIVD